MKPRVLLVDDDLDMIETVTEVLELDGFEVISAQDGDRGWEMVREGRPDLIVLDVMMPGMNGPELAGRIRNSEFAGIPVIMLSAVADRAAGAGPRGGEVPACPADVFLCKPLDVRALLQSVRGLVSKSK